MYYLTIQYVIKRLNLCGWKLLKKCTYEWNNYRNYLFSTFKLENIYDIIPQITILIALLQLDSWKRFLQCTLFYPLHYPFIPEYTGSWGNRFQGTHGIRLRLWGVCCRSPAWRSWWASRCWPCRRTCPSFRPFKW